MRIRCFPVILALGLVTACGSSGPTTTITVLGYTVVIKTAPPTSTAVGASIPIAFTATENESDGSSKPASGKSFTVTVTAGGGTVNGAASVTITTGADGSASLTWILGSAAGTQTVRGSVSSTQYLDVSVTATPPPVASVLLSLPSASLLVGATEQASATPRDANGGALTGRSVTWSSTNTAVATVSTSGLITAVSPGTTSISATSEGQSGTGQLTVTQPPVASVSLGALPTPLEVGATGQASATPRDASSNALTGRTITWSSTNTAVATVNTSGLITGVSPGTTTITATCEGQSGSGQLTVVQAAVASVAVTGGPNVIQQLFTVALSATPKDARGATLTGRAIAWTSNNTAVATVSQAGQAGVVTGVSPGTATITATSEGKSGQVVITVTPAPVTSVIITGSLRVKVGDPYTYTATARIADGTVVVRPLTWSILVPGTATISPVGVAIPLQTGTISVVATIDGVAWFGVITGYDWSFLNLGTQISANLASDVGFVDIFGNTEFPIIQIVCGNTGTFSMGVGFVGVTQMITGDGLVTFAGDNGILASQTWLQTPPTYHVLVYPGGTNLLQKSFVNGMAANHIFTFAFDEFLNGSHAVSWRLTGMTAAVSPIMAACPSNSILAGAPAAQASVAEALFAAVRTAAATPRQVQLEAQRTATGTTNSAFPTIQPALRAPDVIQMRKLHP